VQSFAIRAASAAVPGGSSATSWDMIDTSAQIAVIAGNPESESASSDSV
jgi:hypothetical protein